MACHPSALGENGELPLFTDFTYDNLGVPRNPHIAANADPAHYDLGLCDAPMTALREREDRAKLCGAFKVPTLRNVALRKVFFHNGVFTDLRDVLRFYVQRDTHPERWYPRKADGSLDIYNDLPSDLRGNINTSEPPYDRQPGMEPALNEAEIDDLLAFLQTLNDGYRPPRQHGMRD